MAVDPIQAAARSDNIDQSGLPVDMEKFTHLMDENSYLFLALTRKLRKSKPVDQMKHEYRERRLIENFVTCKTGQSAGASDFIVNEPLRVTVDRVLHFKGTLYLVTSVNTGTGAIGIVRASDGTTATTADDIAAGEILNVCLEAHAEGEAIPDPYTTTSEPKFDYVMQSDRVVKSSDIHDNIMHYDPREKGRFMDLKQAFIEYERDRNLLYYLGESSREVGSAGVRRHVCSGLFAKLVTNQFDFSAAPGGFTEEIISQIMGATMYYGQSSQNKFLLGGNRPWNKISSWPKDKLRTTPLSRKWGLRLNLIMTAYGDMIVGYDPVLSEKNGLSDRFVVLDQKQCTLLHLRGLPVRIYRDIGARNDIHNTTDAISGSFGLQVLWEELGAQAEGVH